MDGKHPAKKVTNKRLILVLGGARSGKSDYAQQLAAQLGERVLYVATATAGDGEMAQRITAHRARRPAHWQTLEAATDVATALSKIVDKVDVVLLDCLTMLASNVLLNGGEDSLDEARVEEQLNAEIDALLSWYEQHQASLIIISNEVGMGLVPPYPLGRAYRDLLGRANQRLAARADVVLFLVAGLPIDLKTWRWPGF